MQTALRRAPRASASRYVNPKTDRSAIGEEEEEEERRGKYPVARNVCTRYVFARAAIYRSHSFLFSFHRIIAI